MAHELTHVKNRDVLIMTIASFFASIAVDDPPVRLLLRRRDDDDDNPSILVVLLVSFVVYILSFFLMLALSRYREFAADRGAAIITGRPSALPSALVKISERHGARADAGPAPGRAHERVLHRAGERQELRADALLDAPADGEADRAPPAARVAAPGHRRLAARGLPRRAAGRQRQAQGRRARPAVRDDHRAGHARDRPGAQAQGRGGIVFQPLGDGGLRPDRRATPRSCCAAAAEDTGTKLEIDGRRVRLPLADPPRPGLRGPRGRPQHGLDPAPGERLRRPPAGGRLPVRAERASPSTSSTTSSAAATTRSSRRRATRRATPSASCG